MPFSTSPKAKWMSPSTPAVLAAALANVSRIPSGSHAHALDSSRGRYSGSPEQAASPATSLSARSSLVMLSAEAAAPPVQHTTPTWYCRSR